MSIYLFIRCIILSMSHTKMIECSFVSVPCSFEWVNLTDSHWHYRKGFSLHFTSFCYFSILIFFTISVGLTFMKVDILQCSVCIQLFLVITVHYFKYHWCTHSIDYAFLFYSSLLAFPHHNLVLNPQKSLS